MNPFTVRRQRLHLSHFDTMQLHKRSPLMMMWWAASFTGFGQMMAGSHVKGYVLMFLEIFINIKAQLNLAIVYSFTGQFALAKEVSDLRWLLFYAAIYIYGLWDAYSFIIQTNTQAVLAAREKAPIQVFMMAPFGINFLHKREPWISVFWNIILPGLGQLYAFQMAIGIFLIGFSMACAYFSHLPEAICFTLLGEFSQATAVCDPQWLLFLPSVYIGAVRGAYGSVVEANKLFDIEQREFLQRGYQTSVSTLPMINTEGLETMVIAATFDHSPFVELALTELEDKGIDKANILAIPLVQTYQDFSIMDTIHRSDGISVMDAAAMLGMIGMVLGTIYGFILTWGPVIWGLIGLLVGIAAGLTLRLLWAKQRLPIREKDKVSEVVILVTCDKTEANWVEKTLRDNTAFSVGVVKG